MTLTKGKKIVLLSEAVHRQIKAWSALNNITMEKAMDMAVSYFLNNKTKVTFPEEKIYEEKLE